MEEIEMEEEPPPFWLQSTTALYDANRHRRHVSNLFLNTGVLVVFLLAASIVFLAIVIPSVFSLARQVFNPSAVKSSWNSLNIILVLFAIVCGFLGKRDEDSTPGSTPRRREIEIEERGYQSFGNDNGGGLRRRLTRNSSSYPDLRQESMWMTRERENQWRFYDDTSLYNQQFNQRFESQISYRTRSQPLPIVDEVEDGDDHRGGDAKTIEVDTCASRSSEVSPPSPPLLPPAESEAVDNGSNEVVEEDESDTKSVEIETSVSDQPKALPPSNPPPEPSPPPSPMAALLPPPSPTSYLWPPPSPTTYLWPPPSPPPPPPPPPPPRRKPHSSSMTSEQQIKEIHETIGRPSRRDGSAKRESRSKVQLPPPPPPPPPPGKVASRYSEEKKEKSEKKRVGVNVTKDFLVSFYHQTKRKKKHQKRRSYENLEEIIDPPKSSIHRSRSTPEFPPLSPPRDPPPPAPPPPPPPPSVFHNLFSSKKGKKKKVHTVSTPAPPPPPPPSRTPSTSAVRPTKDKKKVPAPPTKTLSFSSVDGTTGNGSESPLIPIPPPPPFMTKPPWKLVMQGDYVKLDSFNNSPRSGYSASEEDEGSPSHTKTPSAVSCPSPDVNMKADDFIARFRAKLKLEKMESIKQKQETTGPSPLGPDSGLS